MDKGFTIGVVSFKNMCGLQNGFGKNISNFVAGYADCFIMQAGQGQKGGMGAC